MVAIPPVANPQKLQKFTTANYLHYAVNVGQFEETEYLVDNYLAKH